MKTYRFLCGCRDHTKVFLRTINLSSYRNGIWRYPKLVVNKVLEDPKKKEITLEDKIFNSLKGKIVYNSVVTNKNLRMRWKIRSEQLRKEKKVQEETPVVPVTLRYMFEDCDLKKCADEVSVTKDDDRDDDDDDDLIIEKDEFEDSIDLPYSRTSQVDVNSDYDETEELMFKKEMLFAYQDIAPKPIHGRQWMSDYEVFDEQIDENSSFSPSDIDYGTPDPTIPASNVPCGGCGAHLHCKDQSIPGYLPKELFTKCKRKDLMRLICQRCTFLKNYNTALAVNVSPETYPELLAKIKNKNALVILMVDMTDFPCSIWKDLLSVIGADKPIIVVGNKIDLLPGDSPGWLENAKKSLKSHLPSNANILHVCFTSAKTKFGIEELINKLNNVWSTNGDVYIIGCTNVGKSSLFNVLIGSDFCRSSASDLIQRAVTSPWPGTTLNLLKFPILKIDGYKAFLRTSRLVSRKHQQIQEKKLAAIQVKMENLKISKLPHIIGSVEQTFKRPPNDYSTHDMDDAKLFEMPPVNVRQLKKDTKKIFNPDDKSYKQARWCYDTPGVVHEDHIIDLLTTDEIVKTIPQNVIVPRIFSVRPEQTLYIGGIARVDVLDCGFKFPRIIVYASKFLPISLCETKYAEDVYDTLLGTSYMAVPIGSLARLEKWPELEYRQDFHIEGKGNAIVSSEIVLSSVGWIGVSLPANVNTTIRPWTPLARGIHLRKIPVLPFTAGLRKRRIANTPTYYLGSV